MDWIEWKQKRNFRAIEQCCATCKYIENDYDVDYCLQDDEHESICLACICDLWEPSKAKEK